MRIIVIKPRGIIHMVFRALALSYVITMVATSAGTMRHTPTRTREHRTPYG
jgi:hypothetical protein